jgi:hypothetical protein
VAAQILPCATAGKRCSAACRLLCAADPLTLLSPSESGMALPLCRALVRRSGGSVPELHAAVGERRSLASLAGVGSWFGGGGGLVPGPRAGAAVELRSAACRRLCVGGGRAAGGSQSLGGGADPAGPLASADTSESCDSEVVPLCGRNCTTFIRIIVGVDAGCSSIFGDTCPRANADLYLASRVVVHLVDAMSGFYEEHHIEHSVNRCASSARAVELVCIATAPDSVGKRDTARHQVIVESFHGSLWQEDAAIRHLEALPRTKVELQAARALADKVRED